MKKVISFLLCFAMMFGMLPVTALAAAEEIVEENICDLSIRWEENGQTADWNIWNNPDDPLPAGLSVEWDENALTITLNGANLTEMVVWDWGSRPVNIIVKGENTITALNWTALDIRCSHNVTISGGGTLNLVSEMTPLTWHDYYQESGGVGPSTEYPTGLFTISDVTINARNDHENWHGEEGGRDRWNCGAFSFVGGHTLITDGAVLSGDAPNNSGAEGDVTVEKGAVINVAGWDMNPRSNVNSDIREDWLATLTIAEGGTVNLKKTSYSYDGQLMYFAHDTELVIDGGIFNLDATDMPWESEILTLGQSEDGRPATTVTVNSGELNLTMGKLNGRGITLWQGTSWTQNGGTVTITCDASNGIPEEGIYVDHASYQHYGGTLRFVNTAPESANEDNYAVGMILDQKSNAVIAGGSVISDGPMGMYIIGDMTVSGGNLKLDGKQYGLCIEKGNVSILNGSAVIDQLWINSNGSLRMLGGRLNLKEYLDVGHGFVRFSGGETTIGAEMGINIQTNSNTLGNVFALDEGINAVYSETGKAVELTQDEGGHSYWNNEAGGEIIIKQQGAGSSYFNALMELVNASAVTAGTVGTIRLAAILENPSETVTVTLPEGMDLDAGSVTLNSRSAAYTETANGFSVTMENGQVLRFGVIPRTAGTAAVTANIGSHAVEASFNVRAYTLELPSMVNEPEIHVSGTAAAGAVLTFYSGNSVIGTVTANALGGWSADLSIENTEGDYEIYAVIALDGGTTTTDTYTVTYDSACAVVETLTITNTIHGDTDYAPNQEVSVVINYKDGTKSQNYYTYWPELPDFTFEVAFEGDSGTADRVSNVWVVATDYYGVEEKVELFYSNTSGTWIGQAQFCGDGDIVPEAFRVEWYPVVEPKIPLDDLEPLIPTKVEKLTADSAMVVSDSLTYTFDLSDNADGLAVEDGSGETVAVTDNSFTGETGNLYYATLAEGTFEEFDTDSLCILMPAGGESSYEYQENVHETDDGLAVGDILISGDAAYRITGFESNGSYRYEEAALEEVFSSLHIDGLGLPADGESIIVEEELETALTETFMETRTYAAYQEALATYAEENDSEPDDKKPKVTTECEYKVTLDDHRIILDLTPKITVESEMTANLPQPLGETKTEVTAEFTYHYSLALDLRTYLEKGSFQGAAFIVDETTTANLDIHVVVNGEEEESASVQLKQFFGEVLKEGAPSAIENYLEKVTTPASERQAVTLSKFRVRTNIPFVYIAASVELELEAGFNGEVEAGAEVSFGQTYGFYVEPDGDFRTFYQKKEFYAGASARFHLEGDAAIYLRISVGPQLLNLLNGSVYGRIGPKLMVGGHGEAAISTRPEENTASAEFWFGETLEMELGLSAWIRMPDGKREASKPLWNYSHPLGFIGTDEMPCRFTTVEGIVYVYDDADLKKLIDLNMNYQRFSNGLQSGSKEFEPDDYEFSIDVGPFSILNKSIIKVNTPLEECEGWLKVVYTCPSGNYQITKLVKIKYVPSSIIINKSTPCCGDRIAGFSIVSPDGGTNTSASTNSDGIVVVPVESHKNYVVTETAPPSGHKCAPGFHGIYVGQSPVSVGFVNYEEELPDPEITPDIDLPSNGDPSGYVYEGIESNRVGGATVKLYRSDKSSGAGAVLWDAAPFDQINPLITDALGQYQWMVPSGWYQVSYEKAGYESALSEWMEVPPIRTNVNQNLVSTAPAAMSIEYSIPAGAFVMTFDRPVAVSEISDLTVTVNGETCGASCIALDGDWSVTEDPADSKVCATTFLLYTEANLAGAQVEVSMNAVTYAGTESTIDGVSIRVSEDIYPPKGDLNGDYAVDDEDVAQLLWHTLFPDMYGIQGNADFNADGNVDDTDVAYLLWHTLFPDMYPL